MKPKKSTKKPKAKKVAKKIVAPKKKSALKKPAKSTIKKKSAKRPKPVQEELPLVVDEPESVPNGQPSPPLGESETSLDTGNTVEDEIENLDELDDVEDEDDEEVGEGFDLDDK